MTPPRHAALADLLVELGAQLLRYGCPTHRLEACLVASAEAYDCQAQVFAVPTGLWMSLTPGQQLAGNANAQRSQGVVRANLKGSSEQGASPPHDPHVTPRRGGSHSGHGPLIRLARVHDRGVDLARLARLDEIFNQVADKHLSIDAAMDALEALRLKPGLSPWLVGLSGAVASGSAAFFFGGGWTEALFGFLIGVLISALSRFIGRSARTRFLLDFIVGMVAGAAGWLLTLLDPDLCRRAVMLSGVIMSVPGLSITSGLGELAHKNLVSGTARLMEATMVLVSLIFGAGVISALEVRSGALAQGGPGAAHAFGLMAVVVVVAAGSFAVNFVVPRADVPWAILASVISWLVPTALEVFGPLSSPATTFSGALAAGLFANLMARVKQRPTQIYLIPGIILLVPGAFSFVSLEKILAGDVTGGMSGAFGALLTAGALIIALLLSHALLPPKKIL